MKLRTIENYLNNNGIEYTRNTYGDYYFGDTGINRDGITITLDTLDPAATAKERIIRKYCNRYGYTIRHPWHNLYRFGFTIFTPTDAADLDLFYKYRDRSRRHCDLLHHIYIKYGRPGANEAMKSVMDKYERLYIKAL